MKNHNHLEKEINKRYKKRDKKIGKKDMKVSGKSVFKLAQIISDKRKK